MFACLYSSRPRIADLFARAGLVVFAAGGGHRSRRRRLLHRRAFEADRHRGSYRLGHRAYRRGRRIQGISRSLPIPMPRSIAARHIGGLTMIPPGREADRLEQPAHPCAGSTSSRMPDLQILDTLDRWGIKTLGETRRASRTWLHRAFRRAGRAPSAPGSRRNAAGSKRETSSRNLRAPRGTGASASAAGAAPVRLIFSMLQELMEPLSGRGWRRIA